MENIIKQWIDNPNRNYSEGVALFIRFGGNRFQARYFENTQPRFAIKKLSYELGQLLKQGKGNIETTSPENPAGEQPIRPEQPVLPKQPTGESQSSAPKIPEVAAIAKRIVHETWIEMSRITEELFNLGTENDDATVTRRKALLDERIPLIERYNQVYEAKEAFFGGELSEEQLFKVVMNQPDTEPRPPQDYSALSDLELNKRLHAAQTAITRYNNQLLYQQNKKADNENPMPDCPKRRDIENSLAVRTAELEALKSELDRRNPQKP